MSEPARVYDPYQPPEPPEKPRQEEEDGHRSVGMVVLLTVFTLGIYIPYWLWERRNFLMERRIYVRVGPTTIALVLLTNLAAISTVLHPSFAGISKLVGFTDGIVRLVAVFWMRDALNAWAASLGRRGPRSVPKTFFFGVFYLQHAMNGIARGDER